MYRHGLGDCFLLSFPRRNDAPFQILIDCGALSRDAKAMTRVAQHIRDSVKHGRTDGKARLDVVVGTHEHKDHISGFNQARPVFNDEIEFGSVWLSWAENLSQAEIKKIKETKKRVIAKVKAALASPLGAVAPLAGIAELLAFNDTVATGKVGDAMAYLKARGKDAGDLRYLEPGEEPFTLPGVDGVRVYVLGPPHDPRDLKTSAITEQMKRDDVIYHLAGMSEMGLDSLGAAVGGAGPESDLHHPFASEHRIPRTTAATVPNPYFKVIEAFLKSTYDDPKQDWRRIEDDWLSAFGQLALQLDNDTNNTSLVLAFEFVDTRDVLLFVADAQVGNWQSWSRLTFDVPGREAPMPALDLVSRTVFYKVGHHCSHNATLKSGGLELMTRDDLTAFIPLDQETARNQGTKGWEMPAPPLFKALREKTAGRVVLSDVTETVPQAASDAGVIATGSYIDYYFQ